jgi:excisionase family DNA binding protein
MGRSPSTRLGGTVNNPETACAVDYSTASHVGRLATVKETAHHFRINDSTVYRWLSQGILGGYRIGGSVRVDLDSVVARPIGAAA